MVTHDSKLPNKKRIRFLIAFARGLLFFAAGAVSSSLYFATLSLPSLEPRPAFELPSIKGLYNKKIIDTLKKTPFGSLGPEGTGSRRHLMYYDQLFLTALKFGSDARSLIEVGCASDPFSKYLSWIDGGPRICVAPYKVEYSGRGVKEQRKRNTLGGKGVGVMMAGDVEFHRADWMDFPLEGNRRYDLLICSQVVEHVKDPATFMRKLVWAARRSIISVPYNWPDCGGKCNHVTHQITLKKMHEWTKPLKSRYHEIVREPSISGPMNARIIVVF